MVVITILKCHGEAEEVRSSAAAGAGLSLGRSHQVQHCGRRFRLYPSYNQVQDHASKYSQICSPRLDRYLNSLSNLQSTYLARRPHSAPSCSWKFTHKRLWQEHHYAAAKQGFTRATISCKQQRLRGAPSRGGLEHEAVDEIGHRRPPGTARHSRSRSV